MVRLLLALALLGALSAEAQIQTQPTGVKKMDGSDSGGGGGSGDVESVQITASSPLSGSATCTTGACAFTLGLTGGTLSGLTATYLPVATGAAQVGNSAITHDSTTGVTTFGGSGPYLVLRDMAGTSDSAQLRWDAGNGQVLFRNVGNTGYVNIHASVAVVESVQGPLSLFGYNNDFYAAVEGYQGPSYGYRLRSTGYFSIGSGAANGTMDTFWGRASAGVWGAYTDTSGTLGGIVAANVTGSHFLGGGSAPTVGGSCGTSPTIAGKDAFIKVTTGSGSPTSCVVTFATAYTTAPVCNANASATTTALNVATTTTTVTVSAAALTAAEVLHISCGSF